MAKRLSILLAAVLVVILGVLVRKRIVEERAKADATRAAWKTLMQADDFVATESPEGRLLDRGETESDADAQDSSHLDRRDASFSP